MGGPMGNFYNALGVIGIILGLAKEIFIVVLLFQAIRLANIFIKKSNNDKNPLRDANMGQSNISQDEKDNLNQ